MDLRIVAVLLLIASGVPGWAACPSKGAEVDQSYTQDIAMLASKQRQQDLLISVRSLLTYRTTCVHMHLLLESGMEEDIRAELATHQDCVNLSCYELPHGEEPRLKDVPSTFPKESVAKLLIPDILPADVKQIVVVDVDTLFLADICQPARQQFLEFSQQTLFGVAMEQSGYYDNHIWGQHEFGRGFNGGVVFWNLDCARSLGWDTFWWPETQKAMKGLGWDHLPLGDQDIVNLLVHVDKKRLHVLPCAFNVQLHSHQRVSPRGAMCLHNSVMCLILHGNANFFHRDTVLAQELLSLFSETNPSETVCKERANVQHLVQQLASQLKPPNSS